ncbi:hypothetical protein E2562_032443 [Oryza meyeriana var. granulata]|uniref:Uncharacterized protein n=1 Tax=Oryza meyeriana var. granulata TaxID=110450 RepID=A0A6G1E5I0_9ORYZ|nr:hypothetical protein E2562_032443 [Oryza meyeriana var. granulata]
MAAEGSELGSPAATAAAPPPNRRKIEPSRRNRPSQVALNRDKVAASSSSSVSGTSPLRVDLNKERQRDMLCFKHSMRGALEAIKALIPRLLRVTLTPYRVQPNGQSNHGTNLRAGGELFRVRRRIPPSTTPTTGSPIVGDEPAALSSAAGRLNGWIARCKPATVGTHAHREMAPTPRTHLQADVAKPVVASSTRALLSSPSRHRYCRWGPTCT